MPNHNSVTLVGHLVRDCEVRYTQGGTALCEFGICVNRRIKQGDEWKDKPVFVDCVCWAGRAEFIGQHGRKGAACLVSGELDLDTWKDKETGKNRQKLKVQAQSVQLLGKTTRESQEPVQSNYGEEAQPSPQDDPADVPF